MSSEKAQNMKVIMHKPQWEHICKGISALGLTISLWGVMQRG